MNKCQSALADCIYHLTLFLILLIAMYNIESFKRDSNPK